MSAPVLSHADLVAAGYQPTGPVTYVVTLDTPAGTAVLEVPSFLGPDAAGRRAYWTAVQLGWGDVGEVTIAHVGLEPDTALPGTVPTSAGAQ